MADIYLRSTDGNDADSGLTWALAKATLAAALTAAGAGGRVFVSDNHAETQAAAMTLTSPGTAASPVQVICVDDSGSPEPPTTLATTATVTTTSNSAMTMNGHMWVYGVTFNVGTGGSSANLNIHTTGASRFRFESCSLRLVTTSTGSRINFGFSNTSGTPVVIELYNTTLSFGNVSQGIVNRGNLRWFNTASALLNTIPTTLFLSPANGMMTPAEIRGVDLSAAGSGKNLVSLAGAYATHLFADCKLGASVSIATGTPIGPEGTEVTVIDCDSADTHYRYHFQNYMGTITQETTIVRSGGLSDGATAYSRKLVSTADTEFVAPLQSQWLFVWNETTGSAITLTIPVLTDNVTLTDAQAWVEVEYMGTSGFPLGVFINDRVSSSLTSASNQPTDGTSSWTTTGLGTPVQQSLSVTFTPQEKGWIRARVNLARASTTMYADKPVLS